LLAARGGISFARKAVAASTLRPAAAGLSTPSVSTPGVGVLVVCQDSALWPYTMTDSAGEWERHLKGQDCELRAPLVVMLQREDAAALCQHLYTRTAAAAAIAAAATPPQLPASASAADAIAATYAHAHALALTASAPAPLAAVAPAGAAAVATTGTRACVIRRSHPLVCAVCQDDFVLPPPSSPATAAVPMTATVPTAAAGAGAGAGAGAEPTADGSSRLVTLPCTHRFHPACIKPWLLKQHTCPLCRFELPRRERAAKQRRPANEDLEAYRRDMFV